MTEFTWRGRKIKTYGDVVQTMGKLYDERDSDGVTELIEQMGIALGGETAAKETIGFLTGEFGIEVMEPMQEFFACPHPKLAGITTPAEAYERGKKEKILS